MLRHINAFFTQIHGLFLFVFLSLAITDIKAQTSFPSDTSYFVPWDDNYNLLLAVNKLDSASIVLLLNRGANINTTTADGVTPLMYAAESGNFSIVSLLVERGADINKKPFNGATALIVSSKNNFYEIAEYLVSKKVELNSRDSEGVTAVNYSAALNNYDVMDMLIFYGADKETADNKGNTPLISAAFNNCLEAADLLIQNGALVDATDNDGYTALMTAIQKGNNDIVNLLIDKGANIHAVNNGGYSALAFAVSNSNYDLSETLINMGADVNQKTESGYSIIEIARSVKDDEIVDLLQANDAKFNMNPHFNTLALGPYLDFNFTDYMNGFQGSIQDTKYGIGFNGSFGFRPVANRILLDVSDTVSYQYWERRYYFSAGIDKRFDLNKDKNIATGPYLGLNEIFTFGGYRGSDAKPDRKFITSPSFGWFYSGNYFKTWLAYQYLNYKTPEIKPGRINLGIAVNINLTKKRHLDKRIDWLE
jgi:ankyrin repeat protein